MRRLAATLVAAACLLAAAVARGGALPEAPPVGEALERGRASYARLSDYTAVLEREERIGGRLLRQGGIRIRFRKPFSVRMEWTEGGMRGTAALYERGKNGGKVLARKGGLLRFLRLSLAPDDPRILKENRHPITEIGIGRILDVIGGEYDRSRRANEGEWTVEGGGTVGGRETWTCQAVLPPGKGYYGRVLVFDLDRETFLPVRAAVYGDGGEMLEEYAYGELAVDVGLSDADFDPGKL